VFLIGSILVVAVTIGYIAAGWTPLLVPVAGAVALAGGLMMRTGDTS
jgi:hypothetical protein